MPRCAKRGVFDIELIEETEKRIVFRVTGKGADEFFSGESGGHRWQETSGKKVHTSTITVAAMCEPTQVQVSIKESDIDRKTCRGSGAGGQHRNTTDSAVVLTHKPTGISVRCEAERSQHANYDLALATLRARIWEERNSATQAERAEERRRLLGTGQRGDKVRTVAVQRDEVVDHKTGKSWKYHKQYAKGEW